jgi:polysaccharide biosynthesis transport protein
MSRLIRFVARLYPKSWRERYGAEFGALLEDVPPNWRTSANVLKGALAMQMKTWTFGRILLVAGLTGVLGAAGVLLAIPRQYASTAVLRVRPANSNETGDVLIDLVRQALSTRSLAAIIDSEGLYPRERARMQADAVIERMKRSVEIAPAAPSAFLIQFTYEDPYKAQRVVNDLASRFMDSNAQGGALTLGVLDEASLPKSPVSPNRTVIMGSGVLGGMALGLILALALRVSRRTA